MSVTYLGVAEANAWLQLKLSNRALWLALHIAEPTRLADPATELLGGGYERQRIIFGAPSAGAVANLNSLIFSGLPACVVTWISAWDHQFVGQMVVAQQLPGSGQSVPASGQFLGAPGDMAIAA